MAVKFGVNQLLRDEHFLVKEKEIRKTKNGDDFLILKLSNRDGVIDGKVWGNNIPQCEIEVGKVVEVNGRTQEYNGSISLIIDRCQIVTSEEIDDYRDETPTMIFDIECVGKKFEELDEKEQDYLLNNLQKDNNDEEKAKNSTGLYSIFGKVCAIGIWDFVKEKGKVITISDKEMKPENDDFEYIIVKDEKELLEEFWKMTELYEKYVTYNGDNFDFPYLAIRSGINRVRVPFEVKRWNDKFIDLQNKVKQGRPFKLEMLCKAFGISNPKEAGVDGSEVSGLYYNKEFQKIADYVARDAVSTNELYKIWKKFMSGEV